MSAVFLEQSVFTQPLDGDNSNEKSHSVVVERLGLRFTFSLAYKDFPLSLSPSGHFASFQLFNQLRQHLCLHGMLTRKATQLEAKRSGYKFQLFWRTRKEY